MKGVLIMCGIVIGGIFCYNPKRTEIIKVEKNNRNIISPELKECEMYRLKIEENLKEAKNK